MKNPNHPGDLIRDGARALGVSRAALSRAINRKAGVSAEMAVRLEKAIGSTAGFWLRLQLNYDLAQIQARAGRIRAHRLGTSAQLALWACLARRVVMTHRRKPRQRALDACHES